MRADLVAKLNTNLGGTGSWLGRRDGAAMQEAQRAVRGSIKLRRGFWGKQQFPLSLQMSRGQHRNLSQTTQTAT